MSINKGLKRKILSIEVFAVQEFDGLVNVTIDSNVIPPGLIDGPGGKILDQTLARIVKFAYTELQLGARDSSLT